MNDATCPRCHGNRGGDFCARCAGRFLLETGEDPGSGALDTGARKPVFPYEVGAELGRGSMGVVYRARHRALNREVAIKQILANRFAGDAARRRFIAEAELAARLDHPNIVPVHEVGESEEGPYFAMKLVEGGTLAGHLTAAAETARATIDAAWPAHCAQLLAKIARAVHHAHERGVLHRDLKPGNILLDASAEPYVADFGLARQLGSESSLTLPDSPLGTPAYMSPEQVRGNAAPTVASDVWSLGAILFHLLAGRPPFAGTTALEVMRNVLEQDPDWRTSPENRGAPPRTVPADLRTIALKCLQKEPSNRYPSARALAEDLEHWLRGEPILACPTPRLERIWMWVRRHPALAGMAALALVSLLVGTVGITVQWRRAEAARQTTHRTNQELLALLNRREHERAEAYFLAGDATRGVALLARLLRRDPTFQPAAERLASALVHRPFALPTDEFPPLSATILATCNEAAGLRLSAGYNLNEVCLWDAASGARTSAVFKRIGRQPFPVFSPDGTLVAVVSTNATVELRNPTDARLVAGPLPVGTASPAAVCALRFSRDGTRLLAATTNGEVNLWRIPDATPVASPFQAGTPVRDADLDSTGQTAIACTWDGGIVAWEADTGRRRFQVNPGPPISRFIRWSHDRGHVAALRGNRRVDWIDARSGALERSWIAPEDVLTISCGRSDDTVMVQCARAALLWDASTGRLAAEPVHRRAAGLADLPPGQDRLLAVSDNGTVRALQRRTLPGPRTAIHGPALAQVLYGADGRHLLSIGTNGVVGCWDATSLVALRAPAPFGGSVLAADAANDTLLVASNATCWLTSGRTGAPRSPRFEDDATIVSGTIRPDLGRIALGKLPIPGHANHSVSAWDVPQAKRLWSDDAYPYRVNGLLYTPDQATLAVRWGSYLSLLGGETSRATNIAHRAYIADMLFVPDSGLLLTSPGDFTVRGWAVGPGYTNFTLAHEGFVGKLAIDPQAQRLATITDFGDLRTCLWDLRSGSRIGEALVQSSNTVCLAFSRDGRHLATGATDGSVRVWDAATGLAVSEPLANGPSVVSVCFHPAGDQLAVASEDGIVRVWTLPQPAVHDTEWLPPFAEALAGLRATMADVFELTPWPAVKDGLARAEGVVSNPWARAILARPTGH